VPKKDVATKTIKNEFITSLALLKKQGLPLTFLLSKILLIGQKEMVLLLVQGEAQPEDR
jgi:hypothetical protein